MQHNDDEDVDNNCDNDDNCDNVDNQNKNLIGICCRDKRQGRQSCRDKPVTYLINQFKYFNLQFII